jgi:hypothetical protein
LRLRFRAGIAARGTPALAEERSRVP